MPIATIDSPNATSSRRPCRSTRCPPRKVNPDSARPRSRWVRVEETKVRTIGTSHSAYAAAPPINPAARIDVAPTKLSGTKPSVPRPYALTNIPLWTTITTKNPMAKATPSVPNACGTASAQTRNPAIPAISSRRDAVVTGGTWFVSHT